MSRRRPGARHAVWRAALPLPALLLAVLLLVGGPAFAISSPAEMLKNPAEEARAERIGQSLRCLVCQNQSIEDSDADLARDLRRIVRQHVAAGESDAEIRRWMVARYGDFVRLRPPFEPLTYALWLSPLLALGIGGGIAWTARRRNAAPPPPLSQAERARLASIGADPRGAAAGPDAIG